MLLSDVQFSVDGALIQAWPNMKSYKPKGDMTAAALREGKEPPRAAAHASTTWPDTKLYKKARGQVAKLCHRFHVIM
ncbi:hypothetical protein J5289_21130 [Rhizobium sp. B230/85]|nr:hypothetical protein [Rhizobium sp. B209b/85]QXZ99016.1 hypothetical protein J5289_21130 [Rhizobium sp. B230/85]